MKKKNTILILVIILITLSIVALVKMIIEMKNVPPPYNDGVDSHAHNSKFEVYFGTNATAQGVKNLFSEIRVNNLTSIRNEELRTIGVCFVANNVETDEEYAIYQKSLTEIESTNITEESFNDYKFISNEESLELIKTNLKSDASYTINVPNSKVWNLDKQKNSGFEKDDNPLGATQTGSTGAYYYRKKT